MNFTDDFSDDPTGETTPIFIVDRGHCTFVHKVRNIQKAGGSLAIVVNSEDRTDVSEIVMSDDGSG